MKTKEEVRIEGKPVFYAILYNPMKRAALDLGWALAMHGSMHSDMDLIAVPWTEDAAPVKKLVYAIHDCIGKTVWRNFDLKKKPTKKPHRRIVYTLSIAADWHLDLSIIPPKKHKKQNP